MKCSKLLSHSSLIDVKRLTIDSLQRHNKKLVNDITTHPIIMIGISNLQRYIQIR